MLLGHIANETTAYNKQMYCKNKKTIIFDVFYKFYVFNIFYSKFSLIYLIMSCKNFDMTFLLNLLWVILYISNNGTEKLHKKSVSAYAQKSLTVSIIILN